MIYSIMIIIMRNILSGRMSVAVVLSFLAVSCRGGVSPEYGPLQAVLVPQVTLETPSVKSVVEGSSLDEDGRTYGLFLCRSGDSGYGAWVSDRYSNLRAVYDDGWCYATASLSSRTFVPLNLITDDASQAFDMYCYSPWFPDTEVDGGLSYDLSSVEEGDYDDFMYATYEDAQGDPANLSLFVVDGATLTVPVHFHHALARVVIHLKLAVAQDSGLDSASSMRLCRAELVRPQGSGTPLYTKGCMDILTGAVSQSQSESDTVQAVVCDTLVSSSSVWTSTSMLVHPQDYVGDGDYHLRLYFNGSDVAHSLATDYPIRRSDITHSDGVTCGFCAGYSYHLRFVLQDYVHLEGVSVCADWDDGGETGIGI